MDFLCFLRMARCQKGKSLLRNVIEFSLKMRIDDLKVMSRKRIAVDHDFNVFCLIDCSRIEWLILVFELNLTSKGGIYIVEGQLDLIEIVKRRQAPNYHRIF